MGVEAILVPYDSGHRNVRMGRGPGHLVGNGMLEMLRKDGHEVCAEVVEAASPFRAEIGTAFELHRLVAERVRAAAGRGGFPLVLSGNCNVCVGTMAGLDPDGLGIVWFDGHADFNTPETTSVGGTLDGMGLAVAVGDCWKTMSRTVPGFVPIGEENVLLVGVRENDEAERARLQSSGVTVVSADSVRAEGMAKALVPAIDALAERVREVYVHLDLDVLNPALVAPANEFAPPGGLAAEEAEEAIRLLRDRFVLAAAGIASYDPKYDDGKVLSAAINLSKALTD